MTAPALTRAKNKPDFTLEDAARIYLAVYPHLPELRRYAKQDNTTILKTLRTALQFYARHRADDIHPSLHRFIPQSTTPRRDEKIMVLHAQGKKSSEIAGLIGDITPSRVRQIIRAKTAKDETFKIKTPEVKRAHFNPHDWDDLLPPEDKPKDTVEQQTPPEDFGF